MADAALETAVDVGLDGACCPKRNRVGGEIGLSEEDCWRLVKSMIDDPDSGDYRLRRAVLTAIRRYKYTPPTKKGSACRPNEARKGIWKPGRQAHEEDHVKRMKEKKSPIGAPRG